MQKLKRITSEYVQVEDRIRITALTEDDKTMILWFTLRLMRQLVTHCLNLLEKHCPDTARATVTDEKSRSSMQGLVQQSAEQELQQEEAVKAINSSPSYLVQEVDVNFGNEGVFLIFKEEGAGHSELYLNNQQLRQWLGIMFTLWQKAQWPVSLWPDWMTGSNNEGPISGTLVH